jgi:hypothetical protein
MSSSDSEGGLALTLLGLILLVAIVIIVSIILYYTTPKPLTNSEKLILARKMVEERNTLSVRVPRRKNTFVSPNTPRTHTKKSRTPIRPLPNRAAVSRSVHFEDNGLATPRKGGVARKTPAKTQNKKSQKTPVKNVKMPSAVRNYSDFETADQYASHIAMNSLETSLFGNFDYASYQSARDGQSHGHAGHKHMQEFDFTPHHHAAPGGFGRAEKKAGTPSRTSEVVVVDAVTIGNSLYSLDKSGKIRVTPLSKKVDRRRICQIPPPPEPIISVDSVSNRLIARSRGGRVYSLLPCGVGACVGASCPRIAQWVRMTGGVLDSAVHISTSPNGENVWVQSTARGQYFTPDFEPVTEPMELGNSNFKRVIGDNGDFTDLLDGQAIRNSDPSTLAEARNVVYPGNNAFVSEPISVSENKKRIAAGCVAGFPCRLVDLENDILSQFE